jgi:nucleoside-diphosphate-sugar epimerase
MNKVKQGEDIDGNEDRILNLIHRDDAANAIISCLQADESNLGRIYNVSDGTHATRGQIVAWLAESLKLSTPSFKGDDEEGTPNRKVSNNRILDDLSWSPLYSNYQLGYQSIFENL